MGATLTTEQRVYFEAIPRLYADAGEELTRLARELQDKDSSKITFAAALERAITLRPDLADEYINFDEHEGSK